MGSWPWMPRAHWLSVPVLDGRDFYAAPRPSPDGAELAWLSWDHPQMPWDGCELWVGRWLDDDGGPRVAEARCVAGGTDVSIGQPIWCRDGSLVYLSDQAGWWQPYRVERVGDEGREWASPSALVSDRAEFHGPDWVLGQSHHEPSCPMAHWLAAGMRTGSISWCGSHRPPSPRPASSRSCPNRASPSPVSRPPTGATCWCSAPPPPSAPRSMPWPLQPTPTPALGLPWAPLQPTPTPVPTPRKTPPARRPTDPALTIRSIQPPAGLALLSAVPTLAVAPGDVAVAEPVEATEPRRSRPQPLLRPHQLRVPVPIRFGAPAGGHVPRRPHGRGRSRVRPAGPVLHQPRPGRARRQLPGERRLRARLPAAAARACGGSPTSTTASPPPCPWPRPAGWTATGWSSGAPAPGGSPPWAPSSAPIGSPAPPPGTASPTSRPWPPRPMTSSRGTSTPWWGRCPQALATYRERSPIHHADRVTGAVLLLQGLDDPVVPADQAERFAAALRARGVDCRYRAFAGESHGFRRAETLRAALTAELDFYAAILGFEPPEDRDGPVRADERPMNGR